MQEFRLATTSFDRCSCIGDCAHKISFLGTCRQVKHSWGSRGDGAGGCCTQVRTQEGSRCLGPNALAANADARQQEIYTLGSWNGETCGFVDAETT
jgi:hypothetical protein